MTAPDLVNLSALIDDAKCFALVRRHRWSEGVRCPGCDSAAVVRDGFDDRQADRQRYRCKTCTGRFDDLTGTVLAGRPASAAAGVGALPLLHGAEPLELARLGAPPVAGETVGRMIGAGGARPLRFWWSRTPSSNLARGLLRACEW